MALPVSFGGSRRPPVLPPSRPSSVLPEPADLLGLPLPVRCRRRERPPVPGADDRPEPVEVSEDAEPGPPCRPLPSPRWGRGLGEQGLQRGDLFVYGVEDRRHLVADVTELDGQPVAERAPGLAVRARETVEGLDGAQRVRVALVRLVQQAVALGGVVPHAGQGAADLAEGLVVERAAPAALHQAAGLAEPGGGLVEVGDVRARRPLRTGG